MLEKSQVLFSFNIVPIRDYLLNMYSWRHFHLWHKVLYTIISDNVIFTLISRNMIKRMVVAILKQELTSSGCRKNTDQKRPTSIKSLLIIAFILVYVIPTNWMRKMVSNKLKGTVSHGWYTLIYIFIHNSSEQYRRKPGKRTKQKISK